MEKFIQKAGILIEALPYIQSFKGKITLIKFGGSAMANNTWMRNVLTDIVFLYTVGIKPVIVHGGGNRISEAMRDLGKTPKFVQGYRVTDEETVQTVEKVLFEEINHEIVELIKSIGGDAEGLSGKRHGLIVAEKHVLDAPFDKEDLGFVGNVKSIYTQPLTTLLHENKIPVIAPVAIGSDGYTYNINADLAAGEIARAIGAEKLVFLTDVDGIMRDKNDRNSLISHIDVDMVKNLIDTGVISGGMIPKVTAGQKAVANGVGKTHIINGMIPHTLLLEIFTDKGIGTEIVSRNNHMAELI